MANNASQGLLFIRLHGRLSHKERCMKTVKRAQTILLVLLLASGWNLNCFAAEDSAAAEIITDAIIGGLAGGLVGAAMLALTRNPGQHLEYMAYGAAGGAVAGGAYGLFKSQTSLVQIKGDEVSFDVPLVMPDVQEKGTRGTTVTIMAELISGKF
jgi:peptidoglycan/LPS O-acetylase OafA/YrhL